MFSTQRVDAKVKVNHHMFTQTLKWEEEGRIDLSLMRLSWAVSMVSYDTLAVGVSSPLQLDRS
jgi:hypothetical protein